MRKKSDLKNKRVLDVIASKYDVLYQMCRSTVPAYSKDEFEDIFQDCILFMYTDQRCSGLTMIEDIVQMFRYRFRMIEFDHAKNKQKRKEISYADHIKTVQKEDENE